jgi:hypothetical protein
MCAVRGRILRDARLICTVRDGLAIARPARVRALLRMRVCKFLMVRSAATPRVSNHEARMSWLFDRLIRSRGAPRFAGTT